MKKSDLVRVTKEYLDAVAAGTDPVSKDVLPADSVGMDRDIREAAGYASTQIGYMLANKMNRNKAAGSVDRLYDNIEVLDALAAGREPGTGSAVRPEDPMGSARMRRCFAFAAETMDGIFDKARGRSKASFRMPQDIQDSIELSDEPMLVTGLVKTINDKCQDPERVNGVQAQLVNDWLEQEGILAPRTSPGAIRLPTEAGQDLGLTVESRQNKDGEAYDAVLFSRDAQAYVVDHLDDISSLARDQRLAKDEERVQAEKAARKAAAIAKSHGRGRRTGLAVAGSSGRAAADMEMDF